MKTDFTVRIAALLDGRGRKFQQGRDPHRAPSTAVERATALAALSLSTYMTRAPPVASEIIAISIAVDPILCLANVSKTSSRMHHQRAPPAHNYSACGPNARTARASRSISASALCACAHCVLRAAQRAMPRRPYTTSTINSADLCSAAVTFSHFRSLRTSCAGSCTEKSACKTAGGFSNERASKLRE